MKGQRNKNGNNYMSPFQFDFYYDKPKKNINNFNNLLKNFFHLLVCTGFEVTNGIISN